MNKIRTAGIRMDGVIEQLEPLLIDHIKDKNEYVLLEIGFASGQSHRAFHDIIKENIKTNNWITFGLDLTNSLDVNFNNINKLFANEELIVNRENGDFETLSKLHTEKYHSVLVLRPLETVRDWIKNIDDNSLDFCVIDADHSEIEVTKDFLAIENKMKSGSIVAFHDSCPASQGTDRQSHGDFINVRKAMDKLGLLNDARAGFKLFKELLGTRTTLNDENGGNGMILIQKL